MLGQFTDATRTAHPPYRQLSHQVSRKNTGAQKCVIQRVKNRATVVVAGRLIVVIAGSRRASWRSG